MFDIRQSDLHVLREEEESPSILTHPLSYRESDSAGSLPITHTDYRLNTSLTVISTNPSATLLLLTFISTRRYQSGNHVVKHTLLAHVTGFAFSSELVNRNKITKAQRSLRGDKPVASVIPPFLRGLQ